MLVRLLYVAIVLFWITMTTMLVRSELWPDHSKLRELPIEHVAKLLWLHEQRSDLIIWNDQLRVGHFTFHPELLKDDATRRISYSGNVQIRIPGATRQRVSWDGIAEFDPASALRSFLIGLTLRDPAPYRAEIIVEPAENRARYRLINAGAEIDTEDYTLDEAGLKKLLAQLEFDPAVLTALHSGSSAAPVLRAQQSSLTIHGERIETYLVSLSQGGQTLLEAHISQLGQILHATSIIGYTLAPEDIVP